MAYELVHKPTFTTQLLAINRADVPRVIVKVEQLRASPEPDCKNKETCQLSRLAARYRSAITQKAVTMLYQRRRLR